MNPDQKAGDTIRWKSIYAALLAWLVVMILAMRWLMETYS